MTSETRKFIEPRDIIGVRLECVHCKAILLLPFDRPFDLEHLRICPHCHVPWTRLPNGQSVEAAILQCVDKVQTLNALLENKQFDGFSLMLEVKEEKKAEKETET